MDKVVQGEKKSTNGRVDSSSSSGDPQRRDSPSPAGRDQGSRGCLSAAAPVITPVQHSLPAVTPLEAPL